MLSRCFRAGLIVLLARRCPPGQTAAYKYRVCVTGEVGTVSANTCGMSRAKLNPLECSCSAARCYMSSRAACRSEPSWTWLKMLMNHRYAWGRAICATVKLRYSSSRPYMRSAPRPHAVLCMVKL